MWFAAPACQFSFLGGEESGVCKLLFKCLSGFEKQAAIYLQKKKKKKRFPEEKKLIFRFPIQNLKAVLFVCSIGSKNRTYYSQLLLWVYIQFLHWSSDLAQCLPWERNMYVKRNDGIWCNTEIVQPSITRNKGMKVNKEKSMLIMRKNFIAVRSVSLLNGLPREWVEPSLL